RGVVAHDELVRGVLLPRRGTLPPLGAARIAGRPRRRRRLTGRTLCFATAPAGDPAGRPRLLTATRAGHVPRRRSRNVGEARRARPAKSPSCRRSRGVAVRSFHYTNQLAT